jgi:hypothetical protein
VTQARDLIFVLAPAQRGENAGFQFDLARRANRVFGTHTPLTVSLRAPSDAGIVSAA